MAVSTFVSVLLKQYLYSMSIKGKTTTAIAKNLIFMVGLLVVVGFSSCKTCRCPAYSRLPGENKSPNLNSVPSDTSKRAPHDALFYDTTAANTGNLAGDSNNTPS
ncbi:hypothetical protein NC99_41640 [Sunxiuqinia dokdonensis]|uniref:Uncharacterized protein n=1 Tax=Sunxiuqinia dokdonensis TaxID=1409788 RepID=A0A0L8V3M9_9BACT|nr:hypothetical protein NC99_41640 [Sunxiuqinia dokdonensis]